MTTTRSDLCACGRPDAHHGRKTTFGRQWSCADLAVMDARIAYGALSWRQQLTTAPPPGWPGSSFARAVAWATTRARGGARRKQ